MGDNIREKLNNAYPATPPSFDERMRRTLRALPSRRARRLIKPAVAGILAAMLTLFTLGYAASQSRLLERLFYGEAPTPQAEQLLTQSGAKAERDGVTLTIDEYLLDGSDLYVNWTVVSRRKEPLMLMVSDLETGFPGECEEMNYGAEWSMAMGVLLDEDHPSYSSVSRFRFHEDAPETAFDVTFAAALLRTLAPVEGQASVESFSDTPKLLSDPIENGQLRLSTVTSLTQDENGGCSMTLDLGDDCATFDDMVQTLGEHGLAAEAVRIPVRFTVTPDPEHMVHTEVTGQRTFHFDKFTLTVLSADFTAASARVRLEIRPTEGGDPWNSLAAWMDYEVYPEGKRTDRGWRMAKSLENGVILCEIDADPTSTIPTWFRLIPYDSETMRSYPQYACVVRLVPSKGREKS